MRTIKISINYCFGFGGLSGYTPLFGLQTPLDDVLQTTNGQIFFFNGGYSTGDFIRVQRECEISRGASILDPTNLAVLPDWPGNFFTADGYGTNITAPMYVPIDITFQKPSSSNVVISADTLSVTELLAPDLSDAALGLFETSHSVIYKVMYTLTLPSDPTPTQSITFNVSLPLASSFQSPIFNRVNGWSPDDVINIAGGKFALYARTGGTKIWTSVANYPITISSDMILGNVTRSFSANSGRLNVDHTYTTALTTVECASGGSAIVVTSLNQSGQSGAVRF